jgi:hypothetical protein
MANFYVSHKRVKVLTGVFSWRLARIALCPVPASRMALSEPWEKRRQPAN